MSSIITALHTVFEIANEMYTALGAGVLGILVLVRHGIKSNQTVRTSAVVLLTIGSFLYVSRTKRKTRPHKGKVVFITGCDTGLGFSLCQHIADMGFTVIATFLSLDSKGATDIYKLYGSSIVRLELNVTNSASVKNVLITVSNYLNNYKHKYKLYAVINNAGVMTFGEFEWLTERLIQEQIDVNLLGTFKVTKAFSPLLRENSARLITITSHCAQATLPGLAVYGATKAALAAWSDGLRVELSKYGVNVLTFIPGSFPSETNIMSKQVQAIREMHDSFSTEQHNFYSEYFKRYNVYLSYVGHGPKHPRRINNDKMYEVFNCALLEKQPEAVYKYEPFRYAFYHFLFKFSPTTYLRDFFVGRFMQMPEYRPPLKALEDD